MSKTYKGPEPEAFLDIEEGSSARMLYDTLKSITEKEIDALFPQFTRRLPSGSVEYSLPDLQEKTIEYMKKYKIPWVPAAYSLIRNVQRISIALLNKTIEEQNLTKRIAMSILNDFILTIDQRIRHTYFPSTKDPVFVPENLDSLIQVERTLQILKNHFINVVEDILPILNEVEESKNQYTETMIELEEMKIVLKQHPQYVEPMVDPQDYTQSVFLFNLNTLLSTEKD